MAANKAIELGFADGIFGKKQEDEQENTPDEEEKNTASSFLFSRKTVNSNLLNKLTKKSDGHSVKEIFDRLDTLSKNSLEGGLYYDRQRDFFEHGERLYRYKR